MSEDDKNAKKSGGEVKSASAKKSAKSGSRANEQTLASAGVDDAESAGASPPKGASPVEVHDISAARAAHDKAKPHGAKAHGHAPNIREYLVIFVVLFVLTVLEVVVAQLPGIGKQALAVALIGLALTKAAIVGLFYMHLKHETRILKLTVALPMVFPTIYAVVLIGEAAWRLTR